MFLTDSALKQIMGFTCSIFCSLLVWISSLVIGIIYGIFYFEDHRQAAWPKFIGGTIGFGTSTLILLILLSWFIWQRYRSNRVSYEVI